MNSTPVKRWSSKRASLVIAIAGLIAVTAGGFAVWGYLASRDAIDGYYEAQSTLVRAESARDAAQADHDERVEAERKAARAAANRAAEAKAARDAQTLQDSLWADMGYDNIGDNVYFRWADKSDYSCGRWDCSAFDVYAADGCPNGLYLEAAIMSGGVQVGWTNETFSGMAAGDFASGFFEMVSAQGDGFQLTEANCR